MDGSDDLCLYTIQYISLYLLLKGSPSLVPVETAEELVI